MAEKIQVDGQNITIQTIKEEEYISLTDMIKGKPGSNVIIANYLRNSNTLEFLHYWEQVHNPDFNSIGSDRIRAQAGPNTFILSVKQWRQETNAIGIVAKAGRYGGTYAHKDIAFDFGTWISPKFRYLLIAEFQRLKSKEYQQQKLEWDYSRFLSKVNYGIQTESIKDNLLPKLDPGDRIFAYATEADLLNLAVFGMTAKQWRESYPDVKGNIRDSASIAELTVLSNLEAINAEYIRVGASKEARYLRLCEIAAYQLKILEEQPNIRKLDEGN